MALLQRYQQAARQSPATVGKGSGSWALPLPFHRAKPAPLSRTRRQARQGRQGRPGGRAMDQHKQGKPMNKTEAIKLLTTNVAAWNKYRDEHPEWKPNLNGANLRDADLNGADLRGADLGGADFQSADLWRADLNSAYLRGANLRGADLRHANLWGSDFQSADLRGSDLWGADLSGANLECAKLTRSQVQPWTGEPDWQDEAL